MKNKISKLFVIVSFFSLQTPAIGQARTIVLTGSGDIGTEYNSNVDRTTKNQLSEWESYLAPVISLEITGPTDHLDLSFSPTYKYNSRREIDLFTAGLSSSLAKSLSISPRFSVDLSNNFSYSSDPPSEPVRGITLAMQFIRVDSQLQDEIIRLLFSDFTWPGGQFDNSDEGHILIAQGEIQARYDAASPSVQSQVDAIIISNTISRRNTFSDTIGINGQYEYLQDCLFSFGYSFSKLKSDASFQSDSESHNPHIEIHHTFSKALDLTASYNYIKSLYDISDDSQSHNFSINPTYQLNVANIFSGGYSYSQISYNGVQNGSNTDQLTLNFEHKYNENTTINLSATPYLTSSDRGSDERGYNLGFDFTKVIQRGQISLTTDGMIAESQSATDWRYLRTSWTARPSLQYELLESLLSDSYLSYGERLNWSSGVKSKYQDYGAGVTLSYPINKFISGSLGYTYKQLESDSALVDDYTENRIIFSLSATNELWRN